jgi:hypothetical protein
MRRTVNCQHWQRVHVINNEFDDLERGAYTVILRCLRDKADLPADTFSGVPFERRVGRPEGPARFVDPARNPSPQLSSC